MVRFSALLAGVISVVMGLEPGQYYSCSVQQLFVKEDNGKVSSIPVNREIVKALGPWNKVEIGVFAKPISRGFLEEFVLKVSNHIFEYAPVGRSGSLFIYSNRTGSTLVYNTFHPQEVGVRLFADTLVVYKCSSKLTTSLSKRK